MAYEIEWTLESGPAEAPHVLDITVEYSYSWGSPDSYWFPGDPPEAEIEQAWYAVPNPAAKYGFDYLEICLTSTESDKVLDHIYQNPPEPDYGDDY